LPIGKQPSCLDQNRQHMQYELQDNKVEICGVESSCCFIV
jgi:hypothetical protein